jgi:hypothetical protein
MTMHTDWAEAQRLVLAAVTELEQARTLLRGRASRPGQATDWRLAQEMTEFLSVVADGAWSVRAQIVAARKVLLEAEADHASAGRSAADRAWAEEASKGFQYR